MKKNSRAEQIIRNRKIFILVTFVLSLIFGIIVFSSRAAAEDNREIYTYYTSYEVQYGDTLWSIADKYMGPDYVSKDDFISNIKNLNHLSSDSITAGNYIIIEYSSYER